MSLDQSRNANKTTNNPTTPSMKIDSDGAIVLGHRRYLPEPGTIRREILQIMSGTTQGHLRKADYHAKLIDGFFCGRQAAVRLVTEPVIKRQNNVDKAISRLRHDLARIFGDCLPAGTSWMCFSRKIDGWILYRLPGLGCDGDYHW